MFKQKADGFWIFWVLPCQEPMRGASAQDLSTDRVEIRVRGTHRVRTSVMTKRVRSRLGDSHLVRPVKTGIVIRLGRVLGSFRLISVFVLVDLNDCNAAVAVPRALPSLRGLYPEAVIPTDSFLFLSQTGFR